MTKTKSKKAAPDICLEISNKISTKEVFSVVKATKQIILEISVALSDTLSKIDQDQLLTVLPNIVFSGKFLPVLEAKQFPPVRLSVLKNWADQIETESSPSLVSGATSGGAWEIITSFQRFAKWMASILFLVISESGSPSATVVLYNMPLGVSAANIKTAFSVFGSITHVVLKPVGIWQYVMVYFKKLDSAVSALNYWLVLVGKDIVRILSLVNQNKTILFYDKFKAKLVNLFFRYTAFEISDMISQVGGQTCFIFHFFESDHCFWFALVIFGFQADLDSTIVKTVVVGDFLVLSQLSSLESDLTKLFVLVEFIVKPIGSLVTTFEQFINGDLVLSSAFGLRINKILVHMSSFNRTVGKLKREVVSLKKECYMKDIDMSGDSELPPIVGDKMFSNLMSLWDHESVDIKIDPFKTAKWLVGLVFYSATLFSVI
ncbi:hypothetical protein G9A89_017926 [Geosiphon pyriformis]|nr:hypothetical protein G9A89_017926 [Geosiphon pyriformis]